VINNLILPFKVWQKCRFVPPILFGIQISLVCLLDSAISPILMAELYRSVQTGSVPEWASKNLELCIVLLPWFAFFPFLYALAGYPTRLAFLKNEGITIKDNIVLWWMTLGKSLSCYGFIWRILPWYLLPVIATLMTRELLPTFIPLQYKALSDFLLAILALVVSYKTFPVLFSPLTAAIGMYYPSQALHISRSVFILQKWKILLISILFFGFYFLLLQDPKLVSEYLKFLPIIGTILLFIFLSVLSAISVTTIAQLEANGMR
jgi:hypothetical protein